VRLEGVGELKNQTTSLALEPATFSLKHISTNYATTYHFILTPTAIYLKKNSFEILCFL
jgi:hypothetical protein